ncbi:TPA: hypothetical protein DIV48_02780 [Candidatus Kaiserbacteria bacterium]|nr:MAG: Phosphoesterase, DHHA1 [Parcubacteria group bacterium GW2011_GWA1_56_13]KKW46166.1 MAG: Phosphoesterase, DHHA1 [Parcubacteria group bacterium GW2011_GWB1_57_6]HCR52549.1 hypothetical protein [Candidatus Kaiserbacteria bacterium]
MSGKGIVILYHGGCPDGFGGAYAAWKKFGDSAEYIPVKHQRPAPENLEGRSLYFVDFCYPKDIMDSFVAKAKSVAVLDHHMSAKDVVQSMPAFVFDNRRSGATIAWNYFHPDTPVPKLLTYVEDGDLYTFKLPDSRAILSYTYARPFRFDEWDMLAGRLETDEGYAEFVRVGKIYAEHFAILVEQIASRASLVSFEGYECYLVGSAGLFASDVGNLLARIKPPMGIILMMSADTLSVSLRSDASVDVSAIAKKYGGGGHPQASGFDIKWGDPLPWTVLKEHENPRH